MTHEVAIAFRVPQQESITSTVHYHARSAFVARNLQQREDAEAKTLADAISIMNAQSRELRAAAEHNEVLFAEHQDLRATFARAMPELRKKLYPPQWMIRDGASTRPQVLPTTLWLITSLVLIAAGLWVLVL